MIAVIGATATVAGFAVALVGVVAALGAAARSWPDAYGRAAALVTAGLLLVANLAMVVALVTRDFSVAYVAEVGSRATPLLFTVASLWAAQQGSILFWAGLLALMTALVATRLPERDRDLGPVALAILLGLVTFFGSLIVGPANPWGRLGPVPADGPGPNPLLASHPLMAIHPPLLYVGVIGLAIPFALTVAAWIGGRLDGRWLRLARRTTLGAWIFLTLGLVSGAWWSYAVLGWGGYWAWDPVENVALLPWLTATAFLHSSLIGASAALPGWNVGLVVTSFVLTLVATLITRSGILESVHAFTETPIGPLFLVLLGFVLAGSVALLFLRPLPDNGARLGPRARGFMLNNLLLVAITATVLFGTIFPILAEGIAGTRLSVGAPYFERVVGPLALGLLILVGVGPSLAAREWTPRARRPLLVGGAAGVSVGLATLIAGSDAAGVIGAAAGAFVVVQSLAYLVSGRAHAGEHRRPRRRSVGAFVSHAGVGVLALALVASGSGRREATVTLVAGESVALLGRTLSLERIGTTTDAPPAVLATVMVREPDGATHLVSPGLALFDQAAVALPAIMPGALTDLYVTVLNIDPASDQATIRLGLYPFTSWIWPAGLLVALGGLLAAWPQQRRGARAGRADDARRPSGRAVIDGRAV